MLEGLDLNLQVHLRRRLLHMAAEFQVAQQVVGLVHQVQCKSSLLLSLLYRNLGTFLGDQPQRV